jgi:prepilin-type N-terminal cleavage/methylation domain-containing protein
MTRPQGFTLIELAIVLIIVTILIGGLAVPLSAQIQARRIAETQKTLEEAREAIIGYAMSHRTGALCTCTYSANPSPGNPPIVTATPPACLSFCPVTTTATDTVTGTLTLPTGHYLPCPSNDGTGIESRYPDNAPAHAGECKPCDDANHDNLDDVTGKRCNLFPWATLGVANQDAWGNRLHYSLTITYGNKSTGFSNSSSGDNVICSSSSGGCSGIVANGVPVVILSHGPNGWGAQSVTGSVLAPPTSHDEKENNDTDATFVSRPPYKPADGSAAERAKEFDDLVVWIPDGLLKSRVCPAGGCP